jgi:hypothetical protein
MIRAREMPMSEIVSMDIMQSRSLEKDSPALNRLNKRKEVNDAPRALGKDWIKKFEENKEENASNLKLIFD